MRFFNTSNSFLGKVGVRKASEMSASTFCILTVLTRALKMSLSLSDENDSDAPIESNSICISALDFFVCLRESSKHAYQIKRRLKSFERGV